MSNYTIPDLLHCLSLKQIFTGEFHDGILDSKWAPTCSELLLALASSCGDVLFLKLSESLEDDLVVACKVKRTPLTTDGTQLLCLSLDWSKDLSLPLSIVSSDSSGCLHLVDAAAGTVTSSWKAHSFEAWISAFDHERGVVFSGGAHPNRRRRLQAEHVGHSPQHNESHLYVQET